MRLALVQEMSWKVGGKSPLITAVADELEKYLAKKNYGSGIRMFIVGVICMEDPHDPLHPVRRPKYLEKDREFYCDIKLDFEAFFNADMKTSKMLLATAILNSVRAIQGRRIADFDLPRFVQDLQSFLAERGWLLPGMDTDVDSGVLSGTTDSHPGNGVSTPSTPLVECRFWSFIDKSRAMTAPDVDTQRQCEHVSELLAAMSEEVIVGFELTLRSLIRKANHFKVMAACKICEGHVSDDSYLYFRAGLVSFGRDVYYAALEDPDVCAEALVLNTEGEDVLYIADNAFIKKFGEDTDKPLPRDLAIDYLNYDFDLDEPTGEDWTEEELPQKYPRLWELAKDRQNRMS